MACIRPASCFADFLSSCLGPYELSFQLLISFARQLQVSQLTCWVHCPRMSCICQRWETSCRVLLRHPQDLTKKRKDHHKHMQLRIAGNFPVQAAQASRPDAAARQTGSKASKAIKVPGARHQPVSNRTSWASNSAPTRSVLRCPLGMHVFFGTPSCCLTLHAALLASTAPLCGISHSECIIERQRSITRQPLQAGMYSFRPQKAGVCCVSGCRNAPPTQPSHGPSPHALYWGPCKHDDMLCSCMLAAACLCLTFLIRTAC